MNKKSIDKLLFLCENIKNKISEIENTLTYNKTIKLSDYNNPVDKDQAKESLQYSENEILISLLEIRKDIRDTIKKIDPEILNDFNLESYK